ncbi:MAG: class I SAM-dependent methyltransferase [Myxococcota bacterium]
MTDPYDDVAYPGQCVPLAHPSRLFVAAHLHGATPAPVATARILELGCGTADHLLPLAARLPNARCVGIDRAATPLAIARERAQALGATLDLIEVDLAQADEALAAPDLPERYDYIIAHGLYSWVPEDLQTQLFALVGRWLADHGVAYVSYNALPGWHLRGMVGQMMRFHADPDAPADARIDQARGLVDWLADVVPESDPYGAWIRKEADLIDEQPDGWLFHDLLAPHNHPALLTTVVAQARAHGLGYLGDADLPAMSLARLPKALRETLARLGDDPVTLEQYLDFVLCRNFRRSLFMRAEVPRTKADWPRVTDLHVRGLVEAEGLVGQDGTEAFRNRSGDGLRTAQPILRSALHNLIDEGVRAIPFADLEARVRDEVGDTPDLQRTLARHLLVAFHHELVDLSAGPVGGPTAVGRRPQVDPVARVAAAWGRVPNAHHRSLPVDTLDQLLLRRADGTRLVTDLVREAYADLLEGRVPMPEGGPPIDDAGEVAAWLEATVPKRLARYGKAALFVEEVS